MKLQRKSKPVRLLLLLQIAVIVAMPEVCIGDSFPIQQTGFEFTPEVWSKYEGGQTTCYAYPNGDFLLKTPVNLGSIGFSEKDVNGDIRCMAGDFDDNGYLDFLVWKGDFGREGQNYKAIFYGRNAPQRTKEFTSKETFNPDDKIFQYLAYRQNTIESARKVTNSDRFL